MDRDPEVLAPASLVFVCVKAHDTETAAHSIAVTLPSPIGVCSLQNGWDHMSVLERALPGVPLVAGATALGAYFDSSGALHASTSGATLLAPWGATEIRWPEYAATVLQSADFVAETHEDARAVLWRKLALNAAVNPLPPYWIARTARCSTSPPSSASRRPPRAKPPGSASASATSRRTSIQPPA